MDLFLLVHVLVLVFCLELSTTAVLTSSGCRSRQQPCTSSFPAFCVCLAPSTVPLWPPDVTIKQIIMNSRANNNELFKTPTHMLGAKNEFSISF